MTWRNVARKVILRAIAQLPPNASQAEIKKAIDSSFYWERKNYPYKMWLEERRKLYYYYGIVKKQPDRRSRKTRKPGIGCDDTVPGQLSLFNFENCNDGQ